MAKKAKPTRRTTQSDLAKKSKRVLKELKEKEILEQAKNRLQRDKARELFGNMFTAREHYDWEWLTRDLFRRGYQFSSYDNRTRTVLLSTRAGVKFPINLLWAQMRVVKNQVTNFKPKWEVLPSGKSEESITNAKYSGRLLDYYYQRLDLRGLLKKTVMQGLMFSIGGPWQIGYNAEADKGDGEVYCWLVDTYDFYVDPHATSMKDAEYCGKAVRKTLNEIVANPSYTFYGEPPEKGEGLVAASPAKQFLIQALRSRDGAGMEEEQEGVILREVWIKVHVNEENMEDLKKELVKNEEDPKIKIGDVIMRIVHYLEFVQDPVLVQLKNRNDFPFVVYHADVNPCEFYGPSWAKHIIPINRVLNALESSIFTYNYRYAIGRIVMDKNSGVRMVSNQHGDFIEKTRGSEVTSLPLQPLPPSYEQQIQHCWKYIEDLGGAHEASFGRLPSAVKSGIAIAELKQADSTNQADLVDAMEEFLVEVGHKILKEIAENYDTPKIVKDLGKGGKVEHFAAVGSNRSRKKREVKVGADTFDLAIIGSDNEIRVTIGSWLAYTKTARQERIKELFDAGLIDQSTALEHLEFSDVDDIVEGVRKEKVLEQMRSQTAKGSEEVSDEEIARSENTMMVQEGREVPVEVTDHHSVHLIVHQEALGITGNPIVEKHMAQHETLVKKHGPEGQQPEAPPMGAPMLGGSSLGPMPGGPPGMPPAPPVASPEEMALQQSLTELGGF